METKFNFKSAICTSREQSEKLLALGLKKETADCYYWQETEPMYGEAAGIWHLENLDSKDNQEHFEYLDKYFGVCLADDEEHYFIPAWSLGRLIEMIPVHVPFSSSVGHLCINRERIFYWGEEVVFEWWDNGLTIYDNIISCIEWLIKEGYFNNEYLEE